MMKKHLALLVLLLIFSVLLLSGCNETKVTVKTDAEKVIGTWKGIQYYNNTAIMSTYIFLSNNTFVFWSNYAGQTSTLTGIWEIINNSFIITSGDQLTIIDYLFSENDTVLTIIESGIATNLFKQSDE